MEVVVLDGPPQRGEDPESPCCEGGHTATWAVLHVLGSCPFLGCFGGMLWWVQGSKMQDIYHCPPQPVLTGQATAARTGQNIPFSWQALPIMASPYLFTVAVHLRLSGFRMSLSRTPTIWEKRGRSLRSFCQQSSMSWCRAVGQPIGAGRR